MAKLTTSQIAAMIGVSERTVQRWIAEGRLSAQPIARRQYLVSESDLEDLRPSQMDEAVSHTDERIQALEGRLEALEGQVNELVATVATLTARSMPAPKGLRPAPAPDEGKESGELPDGLVALRDFYLLHHVPETTAKRAANYGVLPTVQGKWKRERNYITQALDAQGRAAFYQRYHQEPYFKPCEECPHEEGEM